MAKLESFLSDLAQKGRLAARSSLDAAHLSEQTGLQSLRFDNGRRTCLLFIPATYNVAAKTPLALLLHGAGGQAAHGLALLERFAE